MYPPYTGAHRACPRCDACSSHATGLCPGDSLAHRLVYVRTHACTTCMHVCMYVLYACMYSLTHLLTGRYSLLRATAVKHMTAKLSDHYPIEIRAGHAADDGSAHGHPSEGVAPGIQASRSDHYPIASQHYAPAQPLSVHDDGHDEAETPDQPEAHTGLGLWSSAAWSLKLPSLRK